MASDTGSLAEVCSLIVDCPHSTPAWTESGYVVLRNQNIRDGRLDLSTPSFTDRKHFEDRNRRAKPQTGDIVITREAPMGEVCMIPDGLQCCLGQRQVLLRPDPKLVNAKFLLYALQSTSVKRQISWNEGTGSTVSNIRIPVLKAIRIPTPLRDTQDQVANVLGALDDRIDNLRATNATLEAIAQALFKSWFVDFDPVHAKAEGRAPEGMDAATATLFPSEFQDSELGPVPKGWRTYEFGEIANLVKGTVTPGDTPDTTFQHYSLPAYDAGQMPAYDQGETIKSNKTPVPSGAVLISKLNPRFPRVWWVGAAGEYAICSTEFLVWKPKTGFNQSILYCAATSSEFNAAMCQLVTGTSSSHQRVRPAALVGVHAMIASEATISLFDEAVRPMLEQVDHNRIRAQTLANLRDTLLPRLISGKLRLPETTKAHEIALA